jgi:hypothetical protein
VDQFRLAGEPHFLHEPRLVRADRLDRQVQLQRNIGDRFPGDQELEYLVLAVGE